jgi:hypothetical protein
MNTVTVRELWNCGGDVLRRVESITGWNCEPAPGPVLERLTGNYGVSIAWVTQARRRYRSGRPPPNIGSAMLLGQAEEAEVGVSAFSFITTSTGSPRSRREYRRRRCTRPSN